MSRILDDHAPVVFHANGFGHPFVDTFTDLALARDARTVVTVHGLPNLARYPAIIRSSGSAYLRSRAHILEEADALVCPSQSVARAMRWLTSRSPQVIPWGVEPVSPTTYERSRPFPALVAVGRIVPLKRFEVLVAALRDLRSVWSDASLVIVGPVVHRRYARRLRETIRDLDLLHYVHLVGATDFTRCRELVQTSDLFASISRQESFGLAVLEAVASGIPTVATDVGIANEVLRPEFGRLLSPAAPAPEVSAALLDLLSRHDGALKAARDTMESVSRRYAWRETVRRYMHLFELDTDDANV